ncbi:hypothetical protein FQN57_004188 [Myotisia sp. PD_48]|nr:hypothetical protein FQN57_004188 [Myotisia sp. PD_48]
MSKRLDQTMMEAIRNLQAITQQLRRFEQHSSCDKMAKCTNEIITAFTDAILRLPPRAMDMNIENNSSEQMPKPSQKSLDPKQSDYDPAPQLPSRQTNTWAKVAVRDSVDPGARTPALVLNSIITSGQGPATSNISVPVRPEPIVGERKAGVVTVAGIFNGSSLRFLTSLIREGPLFSIEVTPRLAEITFQHALHARVFVESDREMIAKTNFGRFGPGFSVISIREYDWDEQIEGMSGLPRERRRLTFARAGLLGKSLHFRKFHDDIMVLAGGPDAIDLVWAFNSGNVTVVFKNVAIAKAIYHLFQQKAMRSGPYYDVKVSYSTDPCEKPMKLSSHFVPPPNGLRRNLRPCPMK